MDKEIIVPGSLINNLEVVARSVFPMEIDAQLPIRDIRDEDVAMGFELKYDDIDQRAFIYSEDFEKLMRCLEHNDAPDFMVAGLKLDHEKAIEDFKKYTECQKRRKDGACLLQSIQSTVCKSCDTYGQPRLKGMYAWFSPSPCIAWHSHVTSKYGDVERLCKPSDDDKLVVARRISLGQIPIRAEMITCTSETGEQKTKIFYNPSGNLAAYLSDGFVAQDKFSHQRTREISVNTGLN